MNLDISPKLIFSAPSGSPPSLLSSNYHIILIILSSFVFVCIDNDVVTIYEISCV